MFYINNELFLPAKAEIICRKQCGCYQMHRGHIDNIINI